MFNVVYAALGNKLNCHSNAKENWFYVYPVVRYYQLKWEPQTQMHHVLHSLQLLIECLRNDRFA